MKLRQRRLTAVLVFCKSTAALVLGALLVLGSVEAAFAQVDRAVLEGTVSDPSGGVIVGADVKLVAVETGLSEEGHTNSKGYYRVSGLPVGGYMVTITSAGFKTQVIEDIILRVGQTRTLDVQLAVGAINEQISVQASTGPADRSSAEASTVIDADSDRRSSEQWTRLGQFYVARALRARRRRRRSADDPFCGPRP